MPTWVKAVASLVENGTSKTFARVFASKVFPEPVGPLSSTRQVGMTVEDQERETHTLQVRCSSQESERAHQDAQLSSKIHLLFDAIIEPAVTERSAVLYTSHLNL